MSCFKDTQFVPTATTLSTPPLLCPSPLHLPLFSLSTLHSPQPVCDCWSSCGVQQFTTLRQVSWPRLLTEYLRGNLTQSSSSSLKYKCNYSGALGYIDVVELVWEPWFNPVLSISAWLGAFEHPVVNRINQRIEDITGLDISTAEDLQVTLTWICIYLHTAPAPWHETFSKSVCVLLGGKLWRWRTIWASLWLWAGKSLSVFLLMLS